MKVLPYIFIISVFICYFISCGPEEKQLTHLLYKAEAIMEQSPDSALAILQQIENPESMQESDYALWCLLFTQAHDKNRIAHTSDSLIRRATNYFEKNDDKLRLMKSYYYWGSVWFDLEDSPRTQDLFLKSLDLAKGLNNQAFMGLIYSNLGTVYIYQNLSTQALDFVKKAVECFSITKDTTNIGYSLQSIGRVYTKENQIDSALHYYLKAVDFVTLENISDLYNELGITYKFKGEYETAFAYFQKSLALSSTERDITPVIFNLGSIYEVTGRLDSAVFYYSQCLYSTNIRTRANANKVLADITEKRQNWRESVNYMKEYHLLRDSISEITLSESLQQIQSLYNYHQAEKVANFYKEETNRHKLQIYQLIIIVLIVSTTAIFIIIYYLKAKRENREHKEKTMRIEQQKYYQTEKYRKDKEVREEKIRQLEESLLGLEFEKTAINNNKNSLYSSEFYSRLRSQPSKLSDVEWNEVESFVETISPDFTERLKYLVPILDISELRMCHLKKLNIPNVKIAEFLFISKSAVSKKCNRLYKKITGKDAAIHKFNEFIDNF